MLSFPYVNFTLWCITHYSHHHEVRIIFESDWSNCSIRSREGLPFESVLLAAVHLVIDGGEISTWKDTDSESVFVKKMTPWLVVHHHHHLSRVPNTSANHTTNSRKIPVVPCHIFRHARSYWTWWIIHLATMIQILRIFQVLVAVVLQAELESNAVVKLTIVF